MVRQKLLQTTAESLCLLRMLSSIGNSFSREKAPGKTAPNILVETNKFQCPKPLNKSVNMKLHCIKTYILYKNIYIHCI